MITVRFEPGSNEEFVGSDCVDKYESEIVRQLSIHFDDVELTHDSPFGTQVAGFFNSPQDQQDANDTVHHILNGIGNNLTSICS